NRPMVCRPSSRCSRPRRPRDESPLRHRAGRQRKRVVTSQLGPCTDGVPASSGPGKIDLYQLHGWDPLTPIEETLRFLDDAVHAGKINYIGLSNFTGWQMQLTLSTAAALGLQVPVTLQPVRLSQRADQNITVLKQ